MRQGPRSPPIGEEVGDLVVVTGRSPERGRDRRAAEDRYRRPFFELPFFRPFPPPFEPPFFPDDPWAGRVRPP